MCMTVVANYYLSSSLDLMNGLAVRVRDAESISAVNRYRSHERRDGKLRREFEIAATRVTRSSPGKSCVDPSCAASFFDLPRL